ncbi:MAG: ATP-binding protein, partial [Opitutales bacterium]|nr:ATP-binding protein [Opitutales bacterium]
MKMKTFTETEHTELKRQYSDSVAKEIVAFLNTDGGTIYIGVDDAGCVCGVSDFDKTMRKLAYIVESQILQTVSEY